MLARAIEEALVGEPTNRAGQTTGENQTGEADAMNNTLAAAPNTRKRSRPRLHNAARKELVAQGGQIDERITWTDEAPQDAWERTFRVEV